MKMSGHINNLSLQQSQALNKLKLAVADIPNKPEDHDHYYLRWLRARRFNVDRAEQMIRNHMVFREEMGLDTLLEDWTPPEVLVKCVPGGCFGEDRDGHPVWYENYTNLDLKGYHRSCNKEDVLKYIAVYRIEKILRILKEFSQRKGRHIETVTVVLDLENLSFQQHYYWPGILMFREGLKILGANYPEMVKHLLMINIPKIFPLGYNLVKHFIDKGTKEKIVTFNGDWKEGLQQYISPDQLPQIYGGTRCEPDPRCTDYIKLGFQVPPEYYLTNLTETDKEEMDRVVVGRGGSCELEYEVESEGSVLRWEFLSTGYDINCGWFHKQSSTKKKPKHNIEVVPLHRSDSHLVPETGEYTCTATGTYVLKFDNSYSWTRSKEVYYNVKILPPCARPCLPSPADLSSVGLITSEDGTDCERGTEEFFDCL